MSPASHPTRSTAHAGEVVDIGPLRAEECGAVAQLHFDFFGSGEGHGHSIALLGPEFLEDAFYRQNLDNPYFFVDVARYNGELIAFSVYCSNHREVFRNTIRKHFVRLAATLLRSVVRQPRRTLSTLAGNLLFLSDSLPVETREIPGWFLLLGVKAPYRTREFRERTGVWIAGEFRQRLESVLRSHGCGEYWAAPAADNEVANLFYHKIGARLFATGVVQGTTCNYYRIGTRDAAAEGTRS